MGVLEHDAEGGEVQEALEFLRNIFQGRDYDLVTKNCNHFADALLQKLVGKPLPSYVNRMSYIFVSGSLTWLVPKKIRKKAPVGEKNLNAYKGFIPFVKTIVDISTVVVSEWMDVGFSVADMVSSTKGLSILLEDQYALDIAD